MIFYATTYDPCCALVSGLCVVRCLMQLTQGTPFSEILRKKAITWNLGLFSSICVISIAEDSDQLLHVEVVIQSDYSCTDPITEDMICAIAPSGVGDGCQGDSGGPLMCKRGSKYELAGAVSFGPTCADLERGSGVYTDIYHFMPWIKATTGL